MGYACPVCGVPQRDGTHLANHLAFTAMLRHGDHEAWLDEHAPGWGDTSPADLAELVVDHAEATTYEEVFEDTVHGHQHDDGHGGSHDDGHGGSHGQDHDHGHEPGRPDLDVLERGGQVAGGGPGDAETRRIVEEARELTRQMREAPTGGDSGSGEGTETGDDEVGDAGPRDAETDDSDGGDGDGGDGDGGDGDGGDGDGGDRDSGDATDTGSGGGTDES